MSTIQRLIDECEELRQKIDQQFRKYEQARKDLKRRIERLEEENAALLVEKEGAERDRDAALQKIEDLKYEVSSLENAAYVAANYAQEKG